MRWLCFVLLTDCAEQLLRQNPVRNVLQSCWVLRIDDLVVLLRTVVKVDFGAGRNVLNDTGLAISLAFVVCSL